MKLILLIGLLILTIVLVIGISLDYFITDTLETQLVEQGGWLMGRRRREEG